MKVHNIYQRRVNRFEKRLGIKKKNATRLSNLRLFTFLLGVVITYLVYGSSNGSTISWLVFFLTMIIFTGLVIWHRRVLVKVNYLEALLQINKDALERINGNWKAFTDDGQDFINDEHSYSKDLDIFGQGSLFQWISTTKTFLGRKRLAAFLANPPAHPDEICKRQLAIEELANKLSWRQRFLAEGMRNSQQAQDPVSLLKWANQSSSFYLTTLSKVVFRIIPLTTIGLIIAYFTLQGIPFYIPVLAIIFQAILLFLVGKERLIALRTVNGYAANVNAYKKMLEHFETKKFKSDYLNKLQKELKGFEKHNAFKQIERLEKIVDAISDRNNAMFLIINILLLWDYQCMMALEKWKQGSGRNLEKWLQILGEVEALASLAIIKHDNPDWVKPVFSEGERALIGRDMGHPLLAEGRVYNDIKIDNTSRVLLITGSNMSGKSTYLRTAGINLVLAYAGAPVCASSFNCSLMSIFTCMRVSDNLEKNISSFYAELLRVKLVVAASKKDEQIFFLLDEIFKGTNSQDRHLGAKILIKELTSQGAIGMVSTHDLELGELERECNQQIKNYHFREYYVNGKISFDYKLRPGISTTRNALYLMKMVGVDTEKR